MAWRRRRASPAVPERLARFVASEWPSARCGHEAVALWAEACAAWLAAESDAPPRLASVWWLAGWSRRSLPFGQDGGAIDVLNEQGRYADLVPPCPGGCPDRERA